MATIDMPFSTPMLAGAPVFIVVASHLGLPLPPAAVAACAAALRAGETRYTDSRGLAPLPGRTGGIWRANPVPSDAPS